MDDRTLLMSAKPLKNGHVFDCYTILDVLGQGGFGITYRALDTSLDREVAIKEYLPTSFAFREENYSVRPITGNASDDFAWGLDSFLKEAKTLAKFNHRNIVRVHRVFESNNTAYMAMEYEHGESLASIYNNKSMTMPFLESVFFPIFDGLSNIHKLDFIHRDIKPSNIYIRQDGSPVLIDFGSARESVPDDTSELTALVSQGYTPLEQYSADYGKQGPWTDIYSLAATIYQGIKKVKPADAISRSAWLLRSQPDRIQQLNAADHPGYDQRFLNAVHQGLTLQPEQRPQSLQAWAGIFGIQEVFSGDQPTSTQKTDGLSTVELGIEITKSDRYNRNTELQLDSSADTIVLDSKATVEKTESVPQGEANKLHDQLLKRKKGLLVTGFAATGVLIAIAAFMFLPNFKAPNKANQTDTSTPPPEVNTPTSTAAVATSEPVIQKQVLVEPVIQTPTPILTEDELFERAVASQSASDYETYLDTYPKGNFAELAKAEIQNATLSLAEKTVTTNIDATALPPQDVTTATILNEQISTTAANLEQVATPINNVVFNSTLITHPLDGEQYTLEQLITLSPSYPPIEGLDESAWKAAQCNDCHEWNSKTLCEQGERYIAGPEGMITRISHPFDGRFKNTLKQWAGTGCQ